MALTENLYNSLRRWRNARAILEGKQPFMVFNNSTLKNTAQHNPQTLQELQTVKGWGPVKIKKYGTLILDLLKKQSCTTENTQEPLQFTEQKKFNESQNQLSNSSILDVEQCIGLLNQHLNELTILRVLGEINEINKRDNYAFFNLKNKTGEFSLQCFLGWSNFEKYEHLLEDGLEIIVSGSTSIYKTGKLSFEIKRIEPVGAGALKKSIQVLMKKLEEKGYFDTSKKRNLPRNPQNIGLITSKNGAVINDFKKNLKSYGFKIYLKDVFVEGDYSIDSITKAIQQINLSHPNLDLLILIRGGGNLESFKAFNSVEVADCIIQSRIPIITGIGHEKDISIADYCADAKFSTPTAVANFLNNQKNSLLQKTLFITNKLFDVQQKNISQKKIDLQIIQKDLIINTERKIKNISTKLLIYFQKLILIANQKIKQFARWRIKNINYSFLNSINLNITIIQNLLNKLLIYEQNIINLNPINLLKKGYTIIFDTKNNKIIKSIQNISKNQNIKIKFNDGEKDAIIK